MESQSWPKVWKINPPGAFFLFRIIPHVKLEACGPRSMHFSRRQFPLNGAGALSSYHVGCNFPDISVRSWDVETEETLRIVAPKYPRTLSPSGDADANLGASISVLREDQLFCPFTLS